jgi:hypothetical protein
VKYKIPEPTEENCKWVTDKLLARNPSFLTDLKPEHVFQAMLGVWIGAHGRLVETKGEGE